MSSRKSTRNWRNTSKIMVKSSIVFVFLFALTLFAPQSALADTSWGQSGWDNVSQTWTKGNMAGFFEGDEVHYRTEAVSYDPTGNPIYFDENYAAEYDNPNAPIGYDGILPVSWFIGPIVPTGQGSDLPWPALKTYGEISQYCTDMGWPAPILPSDQYMGADAFEVTLCGEYTSGGIPVYPGYTGPTNLRYCVVPNTLGYVAGEDTAEAGSFIHALLTNWDYDADGQPDWAIYYAAHLAKTGTTNLFDGSEVLIGAGGYSGASLHIVLSETGAKTVPLPTTGMNVQDLKVSKIWGPNAVQEPVTIKLFEDRGLGPVFTGESLVLDGVVDGVEYPAWTGTFYEVPIYFEKKIDGVKTVIKIIYSVVEDPPLAGFDIIYGTNEAGFTVTNNVRYGALRVNKVVDLAGTIGSITQPPFQITITGPSYPEGDTQTIAGGSSYTWEQLLPGSYTITEGLLGNEWAVVIADETEVVQAGLTAEATVTNTYRPGSLKVSKVVDMAGVIGDVTMPDFKIKITGPSYPNGSPEQTIAGGASYTWTHLIPGPYVVSEATLGVVWNVAVTGDSTVPAGGLAEATVTNTYRPGSLQVSKVVDMAGVIGDVTMPDFKVKITGPSYPNGSPEQTIAGGASYTWTHLIPGPYVVSEATLGVVWNVAVTGDSTVPAGGLVEATVTNTYRPGSLQVSKVVDFGSYPGEHFYPTSVDVTITGPSYPAPVGSTRTLTGTGWTTTWEGLIPGSYLVHFHNELPADGPWTLPPDQTVAVEAGTSKSVIGTDVLRYTSDTAWGYSFTNTELNNDFLQLNTGNSNWGWSFGPIGSGTYNLTMLAGCGTVKKTSNWANGTDVGTAVVAYNGTDVTVTMTMDDENLLTSMRVWAGETVLPQKIVGKKIIDNNAPGDFPGVGVIAPDGKSATVTLYDVATTAEGKIYVAVHGVVFTLG